MPKEQQSFSVTGFVVLYQRAHSFSLPLFKHFVAVSGLKTEKDKTFLKNLTQMIQMSGISLRTTQKQVHDHTRGFAVYKNADTILCSKLPGYFLPQICLELKIICNSPFFKGNLYDS